MSTVLVPVVDLSLASLAAALLLVWLTWNDVLDSMDRVMVMMWVGKGRISGQPLHHATVRDPVPGFGEW